MHITNETVAKGIDHPPGGRFSVQLQHAGVPLGCKAVANSPLPLTIVMRTVSLALLPAPVAKNYRFMGGVCITATTLTLISNVLYMLRGWKEPPSQYFDWSLDVVRWMTGQIWYAIGMIVLFHVVTRPAQSGVVLFGKFPRDLWVNKVQQGPAKGIPPRRVYFLSHETALLSVPLDLCNSGTCVSSTSLCVTCCWNCATFTRTPKKS